ncbi:MAG: hypothetical protein ACLTCP_10870 [Ruminococcus bicirculans (ex Wegman et al. 2014)]
MEMPDYYTEINARGEFKQASGVYRERCFWGIESRPDNIEYEIAINCGTDNPIKNFDAPLWNIISATQGGRLSSGWDMQIY